MKDMGIKRSFLCLFFILTFTGFSHAERGTLVFVGVNGLLPYSYLEGDVPKGIFCDIAKEIFKRTKMDAKIELLSFPLVLRYLKQGAVDGCFMVYYKKERESFLMYSAVPVHRSSINVYVKKGQEFDYQSVKDLYGKRVGKQDKFYTSMEFEKAVEQKLITLDEARTSEINLKKLDAGRIDCYVGGAIGTRFSMNNLGLSKEIVALPVPLVPKVEVFFVISKASTKIIEKKRFLEKVNQVIQEMHDDGTITNIERSYVEN